MRRWSFDARGPAWPRARVRNEGGRAGQVIVVMALMMVLLSGAVGLAVDAAVSYLYAIRASRTASAAALAGVVFMPDQFDPVVFDPCPPCVSRACLTCSGSLEQLLSNE